MYHDSHFRRFEVLPLTGALGADIRGVDLGAALADPAGDAVFEDVRRALDTYHVLAVRGQHLAPERLRDVARRFGPFSGNPVHAPLEGYEEIIRFVREPDDTGTVIGENWHMDLAWMERPPGITMLYGEVIPPVGGDTCFASLEHAYKQLSPGMQALLEGLIGIHSGKGVFAINATHKGLVRSGGEQVEDIEAEHPLICVHPATGRRYLFVASVLNRFKGLTEAESRPMIDYLLGVAVRPEFTCRLRWQEGTLALWANPYVLHTAINDYAGFRRVTYRTTIEGPVPRAATADAIGVGRAA